MRRNRISTPLATIILLSLLLTLFTAAQPVSAATFTVTSNTDMADILPGDGVCETAPGNGMCTLRAAIMETNSLIGADTIILPQAVYTLTIAGADEELSATGDLDITDELTILGPQPEFATISAAGLGDRVLHVHSTADPVTVSWVVISNGSGDEYSQAGGVWNKGGLTMENVELVSNEAGIGGGGIVNQGVLDLTHALLRNNDAGQGGGILNDSVGELSLTDVELRFNSASAWGGGIENFGTLTVQDSQFYTNTADTFGGGIYLWEGSAQIVNTTLQGNDSSYGGGIYIDDGASLTLTSSEIYTNTASDYGAGIYNLGTLTIQDGTILENVVTYWGGGIYNEAELSIRDSEILGNTAYHGGGLYNFSGNITLENVELLDNSSTESGGGLVNILTGIIQGQVVRFDRNSSTRGGAVYMGSGAQIELNRATFQNNSASDDGGAVFIFSDGSITLTESALINNTATGDGGGIFNGANVHLFRATIHDNQAENGGGIYSTGTLELENCTISGNFADYNGGGIYNGTNANVFHSTITYNFAANSPLTPGGRGGGVYSLAGSSSTIQDTILYGNRHRLGISPVPDDCNGSLSTQHYNLVGTLTGCTLDNDQGLDLVGVNPLLGDLGDNGGPTETHALGAGSPAIDAADPLGCASQSGGWLTTDQRGYPLPWDGNEDGTAVCDIGAYEVSLLLRNVFLPLTVK